MFFTRTHKYHFPIPKEELKNRLIGKHVKIHNLDFEVYEKDAMLSIIPHAEQENAIKTLPITNVDLRETPKGTTVIISSHLRKLDAGGPFLVVIFCIFLFITSFVLLYVGGEKMITYTMLSIGLVIFSIFCVRMQMGYFDYVRKVRAYVKSKGAPVAAEMNMPVAAM